MIVVEQVIMKMIYLTKRVEDSRSRARLNYIKKMFLLARARARIPKSIFSFQVYVNWIWAEKEQVEEGLPYIYQGNHFQNI